MSRSTSVFIIMGVSGTGKNTIGELLSKKLDIPFFDGDDFHPEVNIQKMRSGTPLTDTDRLEWLLALNQLAKEHNTKGAVIACSALKASYRDILKEGMGENLKFIYLQGTFELVRSRMEKRSEHFMPIHLLKSQFQTLEPPKDAITVSIKDNPERIMAFILDKIKN